MPRPIDFAYAIHSEVGGACVGAKVNGRIVPLRYTLRNGDIVEIMTQPGHLPSKDWLAIVKTARARNKIKHVINANERLKAIEIGEKYLEKEARRLGVSLSRTVRSELERVAGEYGYSKMEDLYAALGYGKFSARQVLQKAVPDEFVEESPAEPPARVRQPRRLRPCRSRAYRTRTPMRSSASKDWMICWSIARSAAIRFAAKPSSDT